MMDEYLEHYQLFNEQKINIQSQNPLHTKCVGCETDKQYTETLEELTISCGDDDDDICGEQFKVILPTYIHKGKSIKELNNKLKSGYDNKGYNHNVLHEYDLIPNPDEGDKFVKEQKDGIETINGKYNEVLGDKNEKIKEFHAHRMDLLKEARLTMNIIKTTTNNDELVKEKRIVYFGIIKQLNNEYSEIHDDLKIPDQYLMIKDPEVDIINDNYKDNLKPNKKEKKKNKSFISACDKIMCPEGIYDNKDFKSWALKNHPDKKHGDNTEENKAIDDKFKEVSDCRDKDKYCSNEKGGDVPIPKKKKKKKKKEKEKEKEKEETPVEKSESKLDLGDDKPVKKQKKPLTIKDFEVGYNVEWVKNTKTIEGIVYKIDKKKKKSIKVVDSSSGKIVDVNIDKLKIID